MKNIKLFPLLLATASLFTLLSCGRGEDTESTDSSGTSSGVSADTGTETSITVDNYDPALDDSTVNLDSEQNALVDRDAMPDTWVATDGLGRTLVTNAEAGGVREDKYVGLFYWTWHGELSKSSFAYNNQQILDENPGIDIHDTSSDKFGPLMNYHFWNEPIYGYYSTMDSWVLRRHAEMLANAGVDVIFFDNTNGQFTWKAAALRLCKVFLEARENGVDTPQISFLLPFSAGIDTNTQLRELYSDVYSKEQYESLWFRWDDNKPFLMAHYEGLSVSNEADKEILDYFSFRKGQPGYLAKQSGVNDEWGWLSIYPQAIYRYKRQIEQISVGVAQNHNYKTNQIAPMNGDNITGRTYTSEGVDTRENAKLYGANFNEQFEYALKVDPKLIFVTGYNEWVAMRHSEWQGVTNAFPDAFNDEFSRDIEPSKGDLKDHYYYQFVNFVRRFKGVNPVPSASPKQTIDITRGFGQWAEVTPTYIAYANNTDDRSAAGYKDAVTKKTIKYTDKTGRNDLYDAKVAHDSDNIYFMVRTVEELTPFTDPGWMRLYIDTTDDEGVPNWESFEYILNRTNPTETKAVLEKSTGGWSFEKVADVDYTVKGNVLMVSIPKSSLGISGDSFTINFKWSDNIQVDGDIMDFYVSGDVAPGGRFKYQYNSAA